MMTPADITGIIAAAGIVGTGLYRAGSGLVAMSSTVRYLVKFHEDHELRIRALEHPAAPVQTQPGPRPDTVP